ncbi:hypothetical protein B6S44_03340 [Bosea sp. Tri-44]|uniref:hypothetical protein n=1 Tax=Bosea sp. Tri-44 TaxID=1972137 RepID=UPI00102682C9|nr:hypothetical protein [Bosea sp. Tri-44]RXT57464.1 hypothetical protein B6S44_03340 [Bosea sp. Tri-44]
MLLAFVLARLLEDNFRRALSLSDGGYEILFSTLTSIILCVLALLAIAWPLIGQLQRSRPPAQSEI